MTTATHLDILSRLVMLLILVGLFIAGLTYAPSIADALSGKLNRAVNVPATPTR